MSESTSTPPQYVATVLDCPDPRTLAEFYRQLLSWSYAEGHESVDPKGDDWLILENPAGTNLAFAKVPGYQPPTWPTGGHPQMMHLDLLVSDLESAGGRAVALGATRLHNPGADDDEPLHVYADPVGHPFCLIQHA